MILVLASAANNEAAAFARKRTNAAASVITCYDIAVNKSSFRYPDVASSKITVQGKILMVKEIEGVINLLPAIFPDELFFYPPEEREYQAAEFHALLTFFLSALECPVINRPTSLSLTGPFINPLSWFHAADAAGIPLSGVQFSSNDPPDASLFLGQNTLTEVAYLGGKIVTPSNAIADVYTLRLADMTQVEYLKVFFEKRGEHDLQFVRAQTIPDLNDKSDVNSLSNYFHTNLS